MNYNESYRLASEFWENPIVSKLWRDPIALIKKMGWEIVPYNHDSPYLPSGEAYSTYKYGKFFILYNTDTPQNRITYDLHHEAGHIVAGHPIRYENTIFQSQNMSKKRYLEVEATIIGRNIFLPANVINYLLHYNKLGTNVVKRYLIETYNLSWEYLNARFDFLEIDLANMIYPKSKYDIECNEYSQFVKWTFDNNVFVYKSEEEMMEEYYQDSFY